MGGGGEEKEREARRNLTFKAFVSDLGRVHYDSEATNQLFFIAFHFFLSKAFV